MKRVIIYLSLLVVVTLVGANPKKYDCSFISKAEKEISYKPILRAKENYKNNNIKFLVAGVGYASTINGISIKEFTCVNEKYASKVIWGGGDVMACNGQYELGKKIQKYVKKYNVTLRGLLLKEGKYKCSI